MKKRVVVIIPARMAASRFPGKPLVNILDLPMIEHVRRRALLSSAIDEVYVATCDREIKDTVNKFGGKAIMTSNIHQRCTDRVEEAVQKINVDIVVIIQGDEPLFFPEVIDMVVQPLLDDKRVQCVNLLSPIENTIEFSDVDIIKTVLNNNNEIMYYSRSSIPYFRGQNNFPVYRQTGISVFTKPFLHCFSNLSPTPLEIAESIDFLRILQHGYCILGVVCQQRTVGVDRKEDILEVENILKSDYKQKEIYQRILSV